MISEPRSAQSATLREWRLRRIDIRSPVLPNACPVARLELEHSARGRVTDIGEAAGAFDAAFIAAGRIVGIAPRLVGYNVRSAEPVASEPLPITVEVEIDVDGHRGKGASTGVDLVRCSIEAWLDAIASTENVQ